MNHLLRTILLIGGIALTPLSNLFAQVETLWTDDFSDGDFTSNWLWTVTNGSGQVVNGEFVLSPGPPYNDAWAWTVGDTTRPRVGDRYGFYYTVRIEGGGLPASVITVKDDGTTFWIVDLYPSNGGIYLLRGVYPAPAEYINWVTGITAIQMGQNLKVNVQVAGDTLRVRVWTGPFEPTSWDIQYPSASVTGVLWPGVYVGGWYLDSATLAYDNFVCYSLGAVTAVEEIAPGQIAERYSLSQNYPNPFNPSTAIVFQLPHANHVNLRVFDELGQQVAMLVDEERSAGTHRVRWEGRDDQGAPRSSGVYIYRLVAGSFSQAGKMLLIK